MIRRISLFLLPLFLVLHCQPKEKNDTMQNLLFLLGFGSQIGSHYSKIYYVHPAFLWNSSLNNYLYLPEASASVIRPAAKKLILVHGWDFQDSDAAPFLSPDALKARTVSFWREQLLSGELSTLVAAGNYQLFLYDYLTSEAVDLNGTRFRARMDSLFGGETSTVAIYAHSMGGLVTRFALYEQVKPPYLARIITAGTPYHGSPWASTQFQQSRSSLGNLAAFLSNTTGGKDLAWENHDSSLPGSSNQKLATINAQSSRDDLIIAYYGSCDYPGTSLDCKNSLNDPEAQGALTAVCPFLYSPSAFPTYPTFSPSDCIVPATSARFDRTGQTFPVGVNLGKYDHFDIKLGTAAGRQRLIADLP